MSLGAFLGARLGLFLAGVEGAGGLWRWGFSSWWLLSCWVGGGWPPRRVDRFAVWLGFVGEFWEESLVRRGAGRTAWGLAAALGVGLVSGVFGGRWFLVMGGPLKVACSEAIIALEDAAAYLSARFKPFRFDGGGGRVGACCGVGEDRAAGGFVSRRG